MMEQAQLNSTGWYLEQEKLTESTLHHLRNVLGTFETDRNITYHFLNGYLAGIKSMYRKLENDPPRKN